MIQGIFGGLVNYQPWFLACLVHQNSLCFALDGFLKCFNPMEMFPLFDALVCSQNQLTSVLSKRIRAPRCDRSGHAHICFDSSAPKVPKDPLRGIRNRGNRGLSGLCVFVCVSH